MGDSSISISPPRDIKEVHFLYLYLSHSSRVGCKNKDMARMGITTDFPVLYISQA